MNLNLAGKVVLVTGGAGKPGSIGETIVRAFADEGAIPVIIDRNDRGFSMVDDFASRGVDALFAKTDLTKEEDCRTAVASALKKYGRIDILVNNAGVNDSVGLDASPSQFMDSILLNLFHFFAITHFSLEALKASRGSIINIGSKVSMTGQGGTSGYAASKAGILGLTREWAVDLLPYGIRVNTLMISECWTPAYDAWANTFPNPQEKIGEITKKIPFEHRMTRPEEIADTVMFLASDRSSHTTGQHVFVDGGYTHLDRSIT